MIPPPPVGYKIVNDLNYIIQRGDLLYHQVRLWKPSISSIGKPMGRVFRLSDNILAFATKTIEPRFKTNKPYPYGY